MNNTNLSQINNIQKQYDKLEEGINRIQKKTIGKTEKISKLTENTKKMTQKETKWKKKQEIPKQTSFEHNIMCKAVKYNIKNDLNKYNNNIINSLKEPHTSIKKKKRKIFSQKDPLSHVY